MKTLLKILGLIFLILILFGIGAVIYDIHFRGRPKVRIVTKEELTKEEIDYLMERGFLTGNEKLIFFFHHSDLEGMVCC